MWGVFWELVDNRARQEATQAPQPHPAVRHPPLCQLLIAAWQPSPNQGFRTRYLSSLPCLWVFKGSVNLQWAGCGWHCFPHQTCGPGPPTHLPWESRLKAQQSPWEQVFMATAETWDAERTSVRPPMMRNGTPSLLRIYRQVKQTPWPSPTWRGREMHAVCEKGRSVWMHRRLRSWAHTTVYWSLYDIALTSLVCDFLIVHGKLYGLLYLPPLFTCYKGCLLVHKCTLTIWLKMLKLYTIKTKS